jgi:hypothetical protein
MKKFVLIVFTIILNNIQSFAQSPTELLKERQEKMQAILREYNEGLVDTAHRFIYKTYEDYIAKNPVQGKKYVGKRKVLLETESVLILENDEYEYKKIKELKYWGFIDEYGQLERIFNNHCYFVLDTGKICSYVKAIDVEMSTDKNGNIQLIQITDNSSGYKDYLSTGLTGNIEDFTEKLFQSMTSSHPDIYDHYMHDEFISTTKDLRIKKTYKIQKYVAMYNQEK